MKTENLIIEKLFQFGLRIVKLFGHLRKNSVEREIALQLLRSGTFHWSQYRRGDWGRSSRKDFIHKLEISYKEARETRYWIRLLKESELFEKKLADSFLKDCEEILKILTAILISSKKQINY